jgi:hypothetical protein
MASIKGYKVIRVTRSAVFKIKITFPSAQLSKTDHCGLSLLGEYEYLLRCSQGDLVAAMVLKNIMASVLGGMLNTAAFAITFSF